MVTHARNDDFQQGFGGYGGHVVIDHGDGTWTLYGHLHRVAVQPGQRVYPGQLIGYVAPDVDPPHVHFEVAPRPYPMKTEAERIAPLQWLAAA